MLLLIGAGVCGWLFSFILHQDQTLVIEPRKDFGENGMSTRQCASSYKFNSTHIVCESNHNI